LVFSLMFLIVKKGENHWLCLYVLVFSLMFLIVKKGENHWLCL